MDVPDVIWRWAQRKSTLTNPARFLREVLYAALIADVDKSNDTNTELPSLPMVPESLEKQWSLLGLGLDEVDTEISEFGRARAAFIRAMGSEVKAIKWFTDERGIKNHRAWLISWWRKEKPEAV